MLVKGATDGPIWIICEAPSTEFYIGIELVSLSKYEPGITLFLYKEIYKTKGERYASLRIDRPR